MLETDAIAVESLEQQTFSPWSLRSLLEELKQDRGVVLVAENHLAQHPPVIVGWCACRYFIPEAELLKISVSERARRSGVATALLNRLTHYLSQRSIEILFLEVRSKNQNALKLYSKSGFLKIGERSAYYTNPTDSALLLQKIL